MERNCAKHVTHEPVAWVCAAHLPVKAVRLQMSRAHPHPHPYPTTTTTKQHKAAAQDRNTIPKAGLEQMLQAAMRKRWRLGMLDTGKHGCWLREMKRRRCCCASCRLTRCRAQAEQRCSPGSANTHMCLCCACLGAGTRIAAASSCSCFHTQTPEHLSHARASLSLLPVCVYPRCRLSRLPAPTAPTCSFFCAACMLSFCACLFSCAAMIRFSRSCGVSFTPAGAPAAPPGAAAELLATRPAVAAEAEAPYACGKGDLLSACPRMQALPVARQRRSACVYSMQQWLVPS